MRSMMRSDTGATGSRFGGVQRGGRDGIRSSRRSDLSEAVARAEEREVLRARLSEAFVPFVADGRYELPGTALDAVAS